MAALLSISLSCSFTLLWGTALTLLIISTSPSKPLNSIEALPFGHGLSVLSLPLYRSLVQSLEPTNVLHSLQTIISRFEGKVFRPPTTLLFSTIFYFFMSKSLIFKKIELLIEVFYYFSTLLSDFRKRKFIFLMIIHFSMSGVNMNFRN